MHITSQITDNKICLPNCKQLSWFLEIANEMEINCLILTVSHKEAKGAISNGSKEHCSTCVWYFLIFLRELMLFLYI